MRLSSQGMKVLKLFLDNVRRKRSGAELAKLADVGPGTLYPLLRRFEEDGWLTSDWEEGEPSKLGRPRRRFYRITGEGISNAQQALLRVQHTRGRFAWTQS
jgi:PadR family transcriptional regulator, regulatory protein PadR